MGIAAGSPDESLSELNNINVEPAFGIAGQLPAGSVVGGGGGERGAAGGGGGGIGDGAGVAAGVGEGDRVLVDDRGNLVWDMAPVHSSDWNANRNEDVEMECTAGAGDAATGAAARSSGIAGVGADVADAGMYRCIYKPGVNRRVAPSLTAVSNPKPLKRTLTLTLEL
jgi:hypothetical protein